MTETGGRLQGRRIALGITGSIAAYKAVELLRLLQAEGADVRVLMTPSATQFVGTLTLETLSRHPVDSDVMTLQDDGRIGHISTAHDVEAIVVAPATAHWLGAMANGLAADSVTAACLATSVPVIVAPAMDGGMYAHPATQENVARLRRFGYEIVEPEEGLLASGMVGQGRLASLDRIVAVTVAAFGGSPAAELAAEPAAEPVAEAVAEAPSAAEPAPRIVWEPEAQTASPSDIAPAAGAEAAASPAPAAAPDVSVYPSPEPESVAPAPATAEAVPEPPPAPSQLEPARTDFAGRHVVVTAGGTVEPIDPVRFIGNRSTGKMGIAVAQEALDRGAAVTLILANHSVEPPAGAHVAHAETAAELGAALQALTPPEGPRFDVLIMAAAVADFRPRDPAPVKLGRAAGLTIEMDPTPDLLAETAERVRTGIRASGSRRPVLVGFAAETGSLDRAAEKLRSKGVDLLVANDVAEPGSGFGTDTNKVTIYSTDGAPEDLPILSKREVAELLLDRVLVRLARADGRSGVPESASATEEAEPVSAADQVAAGEPVESPTAPEPAELTQAGDPAAPAETEAALQ